MIRTAGILLFTTGKALLVRHNKKAGHLEGTYGLPAGRIELGETAMEAAIRELFEETGLKTSAENLTPLPRTYTAAIERKDGVKTFSQQNFLCHNWEGELRGDEETIPEWVPLDQVKKLNPLPNVEAMVREGAEERMIMRQAVSKGKGISPLRYHSGRNDGQKGLRSK